MRSSKQDSQFLLRKLLFPLEYLIQVKLEKQQITAVQQYV